MRKTRNDKFRNEDRFIEALSLLIKEKPFNKITITDLCSKAKLTRVTFYKHFDILEEVYASLVNKRMKVISMNFIKQSPLPSQYEMLTLFYKEIVYKYKDLILQITDGKQTDMLYWAFRECFRDHFITYMTNTKYEEIEYTGYTGGVFMIALQWLKTGMKESVDSLVKHTIQILKL